MQIHCVETEVIVAQGSDGAVYDLHRVALRSRLTAGEPDAPWVEERVEWLTSSGRIVQTSDERSFRFGDVDLIKVEAADWAAS